MRGDHYKASGGGRKRKILPQNMFMASVRMSPLYTFLPHFIINGCITWYFMQKNKGYGLKASITNLVPRSYRLTVIEPLGRGRWIQDFQMTTCTSEFSVIECNAIKMCFIDLFQKRQQNPTPWHNITFLVDQSWLLTEFSFNTMTTFLWNISP